MYQKQHSHFIKSILVVFLILFSLAPCSVKEVALNTVSIDYTKPSSRTFSLKQNSECKALSATENSAVLNIKMSFDINPLAVLPSTKHTEEYDLTQLADVTSSTSDSQAILNNYSAKYILYKRMKLGLT